MNYYVNLWVHFPESVWLRKTDLSRIDSETYGAECQMVLVEGPIRGILDNGGVGAADHIMRMEYCKYWHGRAVACYKQPNDNDLRDSIHT